MHCGNCGLSEWHVAVPDKQVKVSEEVLTVVIDIREIGAVDIHFVEDSSHVDKVCSGVKDGDVIVLPWSRDWYCYAMGSVRTAYICRAP